MTVFNSYSTGTVSVANGGTVVTGVGSIWSGINVKPGDDIVINGLTPIVVMDLTDTTHLVIDAWPFATQAAVPYKIIHRSPLRYAGGQAMADVDTLIATLNSLGPIFNVDPADAAPDPSWGRDGQYATKLTTGDWWLKTAGVWVSTGAPSGAASLTVDNSFSGVQTFTNTTDATGPTDGSVKLSGGMGIAKNLYVGGGILEVWSTDAGAVGPIQSLYHASPSPAVADFVGKLQFWGKDSAANDTQYAELNGQILQTTNGNEYGCITGQVLVAGALSDSLFPTPGTQTFILGYCNPASTNFEYVLRCPPGKTAFMYLESFDGGTEGPSYNLWHAKPGGGVALDVIGSIGFDGRNSAAAYIHYAKIDVKLDAVVSPNEEASMRFFTYKGSLAERMRLDGDGYLTFGGFENSFGAILEVPANPTAKSTMATIAYGSHASGNGLWFLKTRHATLPGTHTIVQSGDVLGGVNFQGSDGSAFRYAAQFIAEVDGTPGASDMPGRFIWKTTPDGSATPLEGMRLDSAQQLSLGGYANVFGARVEIVTNPTLNVSQSWIATGAHASGPSLFILKTRASTPSVQTIAVNGDQIGAIIWRASDGVAFRNIAAIQAFVDGGIAAGDTPGRLEFSTTTDGGTTVARRLLLDALGNVVVNNAAIATNATNGFLYIPSCAGTPTGVPTTYTGMVPLVVNTTNNKLYFYSGGSWRDAGP